MVVSQLFATSLPGLFETPITADKRFRLTSPKLPSGDFRYAQDVMQHWRLNMEMP